MAKNSKEMLKALDEVLIELGNMSSEEFQEAINKDNKCLLKSFKGTQGDMARLRGECAETGCIYCNPVILDFGV